MTNLSPLNRQTSRRRFMVGVVLVLIAMAGVAALMMATVLHKKADRQNLASVATPKAIALTVSSAFAKQEQWPQVVEATGPIAAWQEAVIGAEVAGQRLAEVRVNVGDSVKKGQVLAVYDTAGLHAELAELKAELAQARASQAQAEADRTRALQLKGSGALSEQQIAQYVTQAKSAVAQTAAALARLQAKQLDLQHARVTAPAGGTISARSATLGAIGAIGSELFRMILHNRLEWRGELTSEQLDHVVAGQQVALTLPDGTTATARVRRLAPELNAQSRLATVYADLQPGSHARAGMYAAGTILLADTAALVVPAQSVVIRDGHDYVFRLTGASSSKGSGENIMQAVMQPVEVGRYRGGNVEILQGLQAGNRVAVQGAGFLNDGDEVRVVSPLVESSAADGIQKEKALKPLKFLRADAKAKTL